MAITLILNLQFPLVKSSSPSLNPKFTNFRSIKPKCYLSLSTLSPFIAKNLSLKQTHIRKTVICARNNKRQTGYRKINRFLIDTAYLFVTSYNILPEPMLSMVKEFGGGNGGGVGFFKGFGGGGRKKNNKTLLFLVFVLVFGFLMWLSLGRRLEGEIILVILGLIVFGALISNFWKRGFKDWAQGVCFIAAVGFLGFRRDDFDRVVKRVLVAIKSRRRRRRVL